ncbi:M50 family metallopeptidase [Methanobacterium oryzae]|uniref:M50 family metallopeptidase n=1 Tax=Methanobacterium oryzae TaxID=69540 RepID=UPI003D1D4B97
MVKFASYEVRDLFISMAVITLAFSIFFRNDYDGNFLFLIPATLIGVVPGFLFHELAHKFMAIKYGFDAEFKMYMPGLFLALASSFFGIILAAPGAVHINGDRMISDKENGKIAIVGPLTNIILAILFGVLAIILLVIGIIIDPNYDNFINSPLGYLGYIGVIGFLINSAMAAINMLPWGIFDGSKVFDWSKMIWGVIAAIAIVMAIIPIILMML